MKTIELPISEKNYYKFKVMLPRKAKVIKAQQTNDHIQDIKVLKCTVQCNDDDEDRVRHLAALSVFDPNKKYYV